MQPEICAEAKRLVQRIIESYVTGEAEALQRDISCLSPDIVVLGPGEQEFYPDFSSLQASVERGPERFWNLRFLIEGSWFDARRITQDTCIVFGEITVRKPDSGGLPPFIGLETRISASVHRKPDGGLSIDSLHYSMKSFDNRAMQALQRSAVLEKIIQLDSMTGLYNRKYTEEHISFLLSQKNASGLLFVVDMDDFKRINDTQGHLKGDEFLKKTAAVLAAAVPSPAIVGRIGGDEFMIFLPGNPDPLRGERVASNLIREISRVLSEMNLSQSCSVGIVAVQEEGVTFEDAYRKADLALYRAKTRGKSRFCWYEPVRAT